MFQILLNRLRTDKHLVENMEQRYDPPSMAHDCLVQWSLSDDEHSRAGRYAQYNSHRWWRNSVAADAAPKTPLVHFLPVRRLPGVSVVTGERRQWPLLQAYIYKIYAFHKHRKILRSGLYDDEGSNWFKRWAGLLHWLESTFNVPLFPFKWMSRLSIQEC